MTLYRATAAGQVPMTAQEEADQLAEWAANDAAAVAQKNAATGLINFNAQKEREAQALEAAGNDLAAIKLRIKHKLL